MFIKLPDHGPLATNNSPFQDPPSARVNGNSPGKEQVNQASEPAPKAEKPVLSFQEQESNSSADGYKETSKQYN